jgi:hypothetical protein
MTVRMTLKAGLVMAALAAGPACDGDAVTELTTTQSEVASPDVQPTGRGIGTANKFEKGEAGKPGGGGSNGILYHGGPVMKGSVKVYYIWYGAWAGNTAPTILGDFAQNIGGSAYYNINTSYTDANGIPLSNAVVFAGSTNDAGYSQGKSLTDAQIKTVVSSAISSGGLPLDANGIYFVLTSADVTASSGFCSNYCGWHTHGTIANLDIKYAFVGNPDRCPSSCAAQTTGPNGNAGADAMASIVAHELEEAHSDPDLNAWYDRRGYENADKCAWTFGTTYQVANGSKANLKLGARDFLIQRNWVNASGGYCALSFP